MFHDNLIEVNIVFLSHTIYTEKNHSNKSQPSEMIRNEGLNSRVLKLNNVKSNFTESNRINGVLHAVNSLDLITSTSLKDAVQVPSEGRMLSKMRDRMSR